MKLHSLIDRLTRQSDRGCVVLLLCVLANVPTQAATQVGSAPYRASATGAGNSHSPVFSADGKHVAFVSHANNLVTNDDLGPHLDLFVRDLVTSNTVLVSVSTNGFGGANDNVGLYSISSNGQVVAFDTSASNLGVRDNNRVSDIYVYDLTSGSRWRVTVGVDDDGDGNANGPSYNPLVSEDGRYVIFESLASNLVTNDFNGTNDIFICDLDTRTIELVSMNADGTASPAGPSHSPSVSADGLKVAFVSHATNLVGGVTNRAGEVYLREVAASSNRWASASHLDSTRENYPDTSGGAYRASEPVLSADGRYVAFKTAARTVRFDFHRPTNSVFQLFSPSSATESGYAFRFDDNPRVSASAGLAPMILSRDGRWLAYASRTSFPFPSIVLRVDFELLTDVVVFLPPIGTLGGGIYETNRAPLAEAVATNLPAGATQPTWVDMSEDGNRLFFLTDATNLTASAQPLSRLYVRDFPDGPIRLLGTNHVGESSPHLGGVVPTISRDGSLIAFDSPEDKLVPDDLNRAWDVFTRNVDTGETRVVSAAHPGLPPVTGQPMSKIAGNQSISGDGSRVVLLTQDGNLSANDTNRLADAILRDLRAGTNTAVSGPFPAPIYPGSSFIRILDATNQVVLASLSANGRYALFTGSAYDTRFGGFYGFTNTFWRDLELDTNDFVANWVRGTQPVLSLDGKLAAVEQLSNLDLGQRLIILRDLRSLPAVTRRISIRRDSRDVPPLYPNGPSYNPVFSPDSHWVVFQSLATDMTYDADNISGYQLYAREIDSYFIKRISYFGSEGTNAFALAGGATNPVFSADARFVFFEGSTSNLIYRHDLLNDMDDAGTARRPNLVVCAGCANPSASSEGRFVAYESRPGPGAGTNIFLKDFANERVELISVSMNGTNGNGPSFTPLLSHDARFVVFASKASDLVPNDNNRATDIFVRDRFAGVTHCLSRNFAGTGTGNRVSSTPILSADGRTVAFQSFASDLVPGDYNDTRDVFVVTLGGPDTDGDGMEDDWEMAYFNTLARDGSGDFDHDGASDLAEFRAGTNPSNDASILRVLRLTTAFVPEPIPSIGSRQTVVLWSAVPGRTYRLESKRSLNGPWEPVGAAVTASSVSASATHTIDLTQSTDYPHGFYRVLLVQ